MIRTLLIDNADSFTLNLFHLLAEVNGCAPTLVTNDWAEFELRVLDEYDNVVISPGPGTPKQPADFGICAEVIEYSAIPVLGVCLGHQGIAHGYGGVVAHAPEPRHGRVSAIRHTETELSARVPSPFSAVRYRSLAVTDLPDCLEATAWSEDGVVQALRHRTKPQWGVQFHPESIASEQARTLLQNFAELTAAWNGWDQHKNDLPASEDCVGKEIVSESDVPAGSCLALDRAESTTYPTDDRHHYILDTDVLPQTVFDEQLFIELFGDEPEAVWLDGNLPNNDSSRLSIMGAPTGPLSKVATASVPKGNVEVRSAGGESESSIQSSGFFDWLDAELACTTIAVSEEGKEASSTETALPTANSESNELPFEFLLGRVGYLGYELKTEVG